MVGAALYEFIQHTADVGLRIEAATLESLFAEAGRGLFALIVNDAKAVPPAHSVEFRLSARAPDDLLYDWLNELVFTFETQALVLSEFKVKLQGDTLYVKAHAAPLDAERHGLGNEIKAVTYHELKLQQEGDKWVAEVIVDI